MGLHTSAPLQPSKTKPSKKLTSANAGIKLVVPSVPALLSISPCHLCSNICPLDVFGMPFITTFQNCTNHFNEFHIFIFRPVSTISIHLQSYTFDMKAALAALL